MARAAPHAELVGALGRAVALGALVRDRDGGEVRVGRDGEPVVRYRLSAYDARHVREGILGAARILEAAGARRIVTSHARGIGYTPGRGRRQAFAAALDREGYGPGRLILLPPARQRTDRAFARGGRLRSRRTRLGRTRPRGLRRLRVPERDRGEPDGDGVAIAHLNASALAARLV